MSYVFLVAGIAMLVFGGDALVRGAVAIAVKLKIPHLIIGLTIVAFGTSAPELIISIRSALSGFSGLAVGNVVGSNIANIWLVLGVPALICAICCNQKFITRNLVFMLAASALLIALCFYQPLTLWHGLLMVAFLAIFLIDCGLRAKAHRREDAALARASAEEVEEILDDEVEELIGEIEKNDDYTPWKMIALIIIGLVGLGLGAELTVQGAIAIARNFGVSDSAIGLTVVAIGTSLPELAATVMAALRGHPGLALGNAIGSNIYNIGGVLGLTALIAPIQVDPVFLQFDLWVMLAAALTITPFVLMRLKITRLVGLIFLLAYGIYIYKVVELGRVTPINESTQPASLTLDPGAVKA